MELRYFVTSRIDFSRNFNFCHIWRRAGTCHHLINLTKHFSLKFRSCIGRDSRANGCNFCRCNVRRIRQLSEAGRDPLDNSSGFTLFNGFHNIGFNFGAKFR